MLPRSDAFAKRTPSSPSCSSKAGVKIPQGLDDDAETSEDEELHCSTRRRPQPLLPSVSRASVSTVTPRRAQDTAARLACLPAHRPTRSSNTPNTKSTRRMARRRSGRCCIAVARQPRCMDPAFADFQRADAATRASTASHLETLPAVIALALRLAAARSLAPHIFRRSPKSTTAPRKSVLCPRLDDAAALPFDHRRPSFEPSAPGQRARRSGS